MQFLLSCCQDNQIIKEATKLVNQKVQYMLMKDVNSVLDTKKDQSLSFFFSYEKEIWGKSPINLKDLNSNIWYQHFKMEELFLLTGMLLTWDKFCKRDLKEVYFAIPLSVKTRTYVTFQLKGLLYEFCCLCLRFSSASLVFTELLKIPISLDKAQYKHINIHIDLALNDIFFIQGLVDSKVYTNIHISTLSISDWYLEVLPRACIGFRISVCDSRFSGFTSLRESLLNTESMKTNPIKRKK